MPAKQQHSNATKDPNCHPIRYKAIEEISGQQSEYQENWRRGTDLWIGEIRRSSVHPRIPQKEFTGFGVIRY
jgi:hypothetical protein